MHMRFYWGFDMTLWSWEVCGPIGCVWRGVVFATRSPHFVFTSYYLIITLALALFQLRRLSGCNRPPGPRPRITGRSPCRRGESLRVRARVRRGGRGQTAAPHPPARRVRPVASRPNPSPRALLLRAGAWD